jgi:hypothetical protein
MSRTRIALAALAAVVAVVAPTAAPAAPTPKATLVGTVGVNDLFKITLTMNGKAVKTLTPGVYLLKVVDKSGIHNFHLAGPGLSKATKNNPLITGVEWTGTKKPFQITLKKGRYSFMCDPHAGEMHGGFDVR